MSYSGPCTDGPFKGETIHDNKPTIPLIWGEYRYNTSLRCWEWCATPDDAISHINTLTPRTIVLIEGTVIGFVLGIVLMMLVR